MAEFLRGDEILACLHRVALSRGAPFDVERPAPTVEMERRRRDAEEHRRRTLAELRALHPRAVYPTTPEDTESALNEGAELLLSPRLARDVRGQRRSTVHALVRVGRLDQKFVYAPLLIKNNEVVEVATTRRVLEGSLRDVMPGDATYTNGVGVRSSTTVTRNALVLAHATRVLQSMGYADPAARVAIIDRQQRVWWLDLASATFPRFNLAAYDALYEQRREVLRAHDEWLATGGPFPTSPYWHRECLDCPFSRYCEEQLEAIDDVSLARFTNLDQQLLLAEHGVTTRAQLAHLDPARARQARRRALTPHVDLAREDLLGRAIDKLDDLIYRARAHSRGTSLRIGAASTGCPTADVEVDIDMESYDDATYLWGAYVTLNRPVVGVTAGYHHFVTWEALTPETEARVFARFWSWFDQLRERCHEQEVTVAGYCFWAQAEDGAMNRAVAYKLTDGPTNADLDEFRRAVPPEWLDLHDLAKAQIQTEGPLGLKQLAGGAGFHWRDVHPSGEASMLWYEVARGEDAHAALSRQRILDYNEDDCRATKALRDWLNGPARTLAHRDDFP